jgi:hypothetical protein
VSLHRTSHGPARSWRRLPVGSRPTGQTGRHVSSAAAARSATTAARCSSRRSTTSSGPATG